ncbi:MAG: acetate/propionate family kinase, partial [Myxococcales bacterium FL481]
MNILVLNCGSSSLRLDLRECAEASNACGPSRAKVSVENVGGLATVHLSREDGEPHVARVRLVDHAAAVADAFARLADVARIQRRSIDAVAHRVVHGGPDLTTAVRVTPAVEDEIRRYARFAPGHNPAALAGMAAARANFGPSLPQVAVFDTAFHASLPWVTKLYPLPLELSREYGLRRFGFHGLAHRHMVERYAELTGRSEQEANLVTVQLGNGCSACAVRRGQSFDTSMGMTPLEGLMMGTRAGDLDPSIVADLPGIAGLSPAQVAHCLHEASGLLGVSQVSRDVRDLLRLAGADDCPPQVGEPVNDGYPETPATRAQLALDMFCFRVAKYIGAYLAALGGAEAIVFGGGIGENSAILRARILK